MHLDSVIDKLSDLERIVHEKLKADFGGDVHRALANETNVLEDVAFSFLSDTIVLGISGKARFRQQTPTHEYPFNAQHVAMFTLLIAADFVSNVLRKATDAPPALAYRGCIAYGDFALRDRFIVGPAVDDAAEHMDRAQGAFVWMTPSAIAASAGGPLGPVENVALFPYAVPMKGGDTFETYVVSPFDRAGTSAQAIDLSNRILSTFSGGLDVAIKGQNTSRFLQEALNRLWPRPLPNAGVAPPCDVPPE